MAAFRRTTDLDGVLHQRHNSVQPTSALGRLRGLTDRAGEGTCGRAVSWPRFVARCPTELSRRVTPSLK